jgi:hypothetical protein
MFQKYGKNVGKKLIRTKTEQTIFGIDVKTFWWFGTVIKEN